MAVQKPAAKAVAASDDDDEDDDVEDDEMDAENVPAANSKKRKADEATVSEAPEAKKAAPAGSCAYSPRYLLLLLDEWVSCRMRGSVCFCVCQSVHVMCEQFAFVLVYSLVLHVASQQQP